MAFIKTNKAESYQPITSKIAVEAIEDQLKKTGSFNVLNLPENARKAFLKEIDSDER